MSDKGTKRLIAEHLGALFGSLSKLLDETLFLRLGWFVDALPQPYTNVAQSAAALAAAAEALAAGGADDLNQIKQLLDQTATLYGAVKALPTTQPLPTGVDATIFAQEFVDRVTSIVITDYLSSKLPTLYHALVMLGVVVQDVHPAVPAGPNQVARPQSIERRIDYQALADILSDPGSIPKRAYGWGTASFDFARVAAPLIELLTAAGLIAGFQVADRLLSDALFPTTNKLNSVKRLAYVSFFNGPVLGVPVDLGIALNDLPADATHPLPGIIVHPRFPDIQQSIQVGANTTVSAKGGVDLSQSFAFLVRPDQKPEVRFPFVGGNVPSGGVLLSLDFAPPQPSVLLGRKGATRLEVKGATVRAFVGNTGSEFEVAAEAAAFDLKVVVVPGDADSFFGALLGSKTLEINLPASVRWSSVKGFSFVGSGGFEIALTPDITFGPVRISKLGIKVEGGVAQGAPAVRASGIADVDATLGPVTAAVSGIGVALDFQFRDGNAGPFEVDVDFKPPTGVGIAVNGGAISGGGFLSFEPDVGRYSGAIELEAYSISIKAFGLIETKVPGGGFSFVVVISTEFATPIQLGLGFTLNGVGGLIGINRTVNSDALRALVVAGRTENLLFPKNVIANAPAIIRDLGTVFPAREGHYVFGPLAKLGWGTPTLITAELALILELPGPVLTLIGEVKCLLPKPDVALVKFNMSIAGQLDFPHKTFSLDAALHDSVIEGYPVSGQMALRLRWGEQPNFALSIGGFHPAYQPPPNFPKLQPMTVALAQQGSTSVTVSGFFALTSNTLQIGGEARLHAGGSGISLDASIAVKTIFIFSPFSFAANIDASVKISFHGHGPSVHLSGVLSGPSPWRAKGEVCVSILWWDACLRFDQTFGGTTTVPEPVLDPWLGSATVQGLKGALQDAKNWAALPPAGSFAVVSRAAGANDLVDPLGGFTVRQKAVPVETTLAIARFGPARAAEPATARTGPIFFKGATGTYGTSIPLAQADVLKDFFAPAQFFELNDAKKLSAKSFDKYGSGYSFAIKPGNIEAGSIGSRQIQYTTVILGSGGTVTAPQLYDLPPTHLAAKSGTSAVAKGGFAQSGSRRYIDPAFTQPFDINDVGFALANADSLQAVTPGAPPLPRADALVALDDYIALHPEKRGQVQVVATYELAA